MHVRLAHGVVDEEGPQDEGDAENGELESKPGQGHLDRLFHVAVVEIGAGQDTDADTDEHGRGKRDESVQLFVVTELLDAAIHVPVRFLVNLLHPHVRDKMHKEIFDGTRDEPGTNGNADRLHDVGAGCGVPRVPCPAGIAHTGQRGTAKHKDEKPPSSVVDTEEDVDQALDAEKGTHDSISRCGNLSNWNVGHLGK